MSEIVPAACRAARDGITDYLDDALPPPRRRALDSHLTSCPACRQWLDEMGLTLRALADLPRQPMPPRMKETLQRSFRDRPAD